MADLQSLVLDVKSRIQLDESIFSLADIERHVYLALHHLFPEKTIEALTNTEAVAVILRAHIDVCHIMASRYARHFSIKTLNAETNEGQVVRNYLDLAKSLQGELDELVEDNFSTDYVVQQGKLVKRDTYRGYNTERNLRTGLPSGMHSHITNLSGTWSGGLLALSWTPTTSKYFYKYEIWAATSAGVVDNTKQGNLTGNPPVKAGARKLKEIHTAEVAAFSAEGLPQVTTYVVVFTLLENGQYVASSEITVTP